LNSNQGWDFPKPSTDYEPLGDLGGISAMTEDISQDHPDHMRIVIALNGGGDQIGR
jgi:hypothetical protein